MSSSSTAAGLTSEMWRGSVSTIDLRVVRGSAAAMGGVAILWPFLPHPPLCPLLAITGVPCPLCGATRSVVSALRGDVVQSLRYSPIGLVVIACVIAAFVAWRKRNVAISMWPVVGVLAAIWLYNLTLNPTFT